MKGTAIEKPLTAFMRKNDQLLLGVLMFGIWAAGYFSISHIIEGHNVRVLPRLDLDQRIPFIPEFVFIYLTIYPLFLLPFLYIRNSGFFRIFSLAYITVMLVCYATYLVYPVAMERPTFVEHSFATWALGIVYRTDRPLNCFPSMHVAMSLLASLTIMEVHRVRGLLMMLLTLLIAVSTLLIKQHYILDVVAGVSLTILVYSLYFRQRIIDVLYENFQRIEDSLEKLISRKIEERILESMEQGPVRDKLTSIVHRLLQEDSKGSASKRDSKQKG
jgi:membrane-associated phospholipid phosphatase